jgi:hypothetical protein
VWLEKEKGGRSTSTFGTEHSSQIDRFLPERVILRFHQMIQHFNPKSMIWGCVFQVLTRSDYLLDESNIS